MRPMIRSVLGILSLLAASTSATAATITFDNGAASAGAFVTMNSGVTTGSVLWNGSGDTIVAPTGSITGGTLTANAVYNMTGYNGSTNQFRLVFNANEPNGQPDITISTLSLVFQDAAGTPLFNATLGGPQTVSGDPAQSYGFLVDLSVAEAAQFFGTSGGHLGMTFSLLDNEGQEDSFGISRSVPNSVAFLGDTPPDPGVSAVPEPATMAVFGLMGLAGLGCIRRRKAA